MPLEGPPPPPPRYSVPYLLHVLFACVQFSTFNNISCGKNMCVMCTNELQAVRPDSPSS